MITEEFGGQVAVSSRFGQGSSFFASFKLSYFSISATSGLKLSGLDLKLQVIKDKQMRKC